MAYVKKIEDYLVKDEEARNSIATLQVNDTTQTTKINELVEKSNKNTGDIVALTNGLNSTNGRVTTLESDVEELKTNGGVKINYDATNESITFS